MTRAVRAVALLAIFAVVVVGIGSLRTSSSTGRVAYLEAGWGGYEADITAKSVAATSECDINFMIHDRSQDGVLCRARSEYGVRLVGGMTVNFSVGDENNGCFLTAAVRQEPDKMTVDKITRIKRNGKVVLLQQVSGPVLQ
jgi:hypothetical protein